MPVSICRSSDAHVRACGVKQRRRASTSHFMCGVVDRSLYNHRLMSLWNDARRDKSGGSVGCANNKKSKAITG